MRAAGAQKQEAQRLHRRNTSVGTTRPRLQAPMQRRQPTTDGAATPRAADSDEHVHMATQAGAVAVCAPHLASTSTSSTLPSTSSLMRASSSVCCRKQEAVVTIYFEF